MTAAGGGHLAIDVAIGIPSWSRTATRDGKLRPSPPSMAFEIITRTAIGVTLFWMSYLDLPFLRPWHSRDGFWVAPDARSYYQAALTLAERQAPRKYGHKGLTRFRHGLIGVDASGRLEPGERALPQPDLVVVLCVLVVRACRPFDRTARVASRPAWSPSASRRSCWRTVRSRSKTMCVHF